jgi:ABC-2 type transport system ATP-binding protein
MNWRPAIRRATSLDRWTVGRSMPRTIAIAAAGLCRRYGRRWALKNVGFEVPEGALVMVTGRNGSGKSTLLRILAAAIRADQGKVRILGYDARGDRERVRERTALLGHRTHLYEPLTALENLAVFARFLGQDPGREALRGRLEEVGLADRGDDPVQTFSAGMRQRLALARVLQQDAPVVLLDEPYGHLDPPGFLLVDRLLQRLRGHGATVLVATHLLPRGRALCDRALVLEAGRLVFAGATAEMPEPVDADGAGLAKGA